MQPPQHLTDLALFEQLPALRLIYSAFVPANPSLPNRRATFRGCNLIMNWMDAVYMVVVRLDITEQVPVPGHPPIDLNKVLFYGIRHDGTVQTYYYNGVQGSEEHYKQPLLQFLRDSNFAPFVAAREREAAERAQARARAIHEELVAAVWRPDRVTKWLDQGGWDLIDAL